MTDKSPGHKKENTRPPASVAWNPFMLWPQAMARDLTEMGEKMMDAPGNMHLRHFMPFSLWGPNEEIFTAFRKSMDPFMAPAASFWFGQLQPHVDVIENNDGISVRAELPGIDPAQVSVLLDDGVLVISGEKQKREQQEGRSYLRRECATGSFSRTLPLPAGLDVGAAQARFEHHVLHIDIPKTGNKGGMEKRAKSTKRERKPKSR